MYVSKHYTCEEIDQRLLQGYYDDFVKAGFGGTIQEFWAFILSIADKVDKKEGYDLSKNDFTDELKAKLDGIEEKANYITKVSQLENDSKFQTEEDVRKAISDLVDGADDALDTLKELADALGNDPNFATTITNKLTDLRTKLTEEVNRAKEAEAGLGTAISHVQDNLDAAVTQLVSKIDTARAELLDYISRVDTKVDKNTKDIQELDNKLNESTTALETELKGLIVKEKEDRINADKVITDELLELKNTHNSDKAELENKILEEASTRINADASLNSRIDTEIATRQSEVLNLETKLNQEKTDRVAADQSVLDRLSEEVTNRTTGDNLLQGNIEKEVQAREAADQVLQSNIDSEATLRDAQDKVLDAKIESIKSVGEANKTQILEALADEVQNRKDADNLLKEGKVDKIEGYSLTKNDFTDILKAKLDGIEEKANYITKLSELVNDSGYQTEADVNAAIEAVIGSAPEVLDTLKEIADALGNDPNFATTITKKLAAITEQLNQEIEDREAGDLANSAEVATETQARKDADTALEGKLKTYVDNKSATSDTAIGVLRNDLTSEIQNRKDADTAIQTALAKEVSDRETADATHTTQLNALIQRVSDLNLSLQEAINMVKNELNEKINDNTTDIATLKTQVSDISTSVSDIRQSVESKFTNVSNKVSVEIQERKDADTALASRIDAQSVNLESERTARELADTNISDKLDSEIEVRKLADTTLDSKLTHLIDDEAAAREAADDRLESLISSNNEPFMQQINALSQIITQEKVERMDEDKALSDRIDASNQAITDEVTRATQKEEALKAEIDTLKDNSKDSIDALTTSLATERSERTAADTQISSRIDNLLPDQLLYDFSLPNGSPNTTLIHITKNYAKKNADGEYRLDGSLNKSVTLPAATSEKAGVMTAADKVKLDTTLPNQIASVSTELTNFKNTKGQANGLASLESDGKVPSSQLPSYVDDVIDVYATYTNSDSGLTDIHLYSDAEHTEEISGEGGKIYIDITTGSSYQFRWSGTEWVPIVSGGVVIGEVAGTAFDGAKGRALEFMVNTLKYFYEQMPNYIYDINGGDHAWKVREMSDIYGEYLVVAARVLYKDNGFYPYEYNTYPGGPGTELGFHIRTATTEKIGLMSKEDKKKLNNLPSRDILVNLKVSPGEGDPDNLLLTTDFWGEVLSGSGIQQVYSETLRLPAATSEKAGVMTAADKAKLDLLKGDTVAIGNVNTLENNDGTDDLDLLTIKSTDTIATAVAKIEQRIDHNEEVVAAMGTDLNQKVNGVLPINTILMAPANIENPFGDKWLLCDGSAVFTSDYPDLMNLEGIGDLRKLPIITDPNNQLKYYIKAR